MREHPSWSAAKSAKTLKHPELLRAIRYWTGKQITDNPFDVSDVTIEGGYQTCGGCGGMLLNGTRVFRLGDTFMHKTCATRNSAPEWKRLRRSKAFLKLDLEGTPWVSEPGVKNRQSDIVVNPEWTQERVAAIVDTVAGYRLKEEPGNFRRSVNDPENTDGDDFGGEQATYSGMRHNGSVIPDCREALQHAAMRCDRPRVARLMEQLLEVSVLREERASLYRGMTPVAIDDARRAAMPFVDTADLRSPGLDYVGDHVADHLYEYNDYDDSGEETKELSE
jgi:hypothetical protein